MKRSYYSCSNILGVALLAGLWTIACSSDEGTNNTATGGSTASSTGGKSSTGTAKTGGASSTGTAKTGGAPGTGGTVATTGTGGASATSTTGTKPTGGTTSTSTSGVGGVAGGGGVGGTVAGGAGTGGIASTATTATGGDAATDASVCTGCLKLYVPLAAANAQTDFEVDYGTSTTIDMSVANAAITARVYVDTQSTGGLRIYAKNDDITGYASVYSTWANLTDLDGKWTDIKLDLAAVAAGPTPPVSGTFDKSIIRWVGINVNAGDAPDGSVVEPVTIYVDSIKFTPAGVTDDFGFSSSIEGFAINTYNNPVTGSTITFTNSM